MAFRFFFKESRLLPLVLLLAFAHLAEAQNRATVEKQLTERVDQVYKLFVSGEWRKVSPFIAEESQDIWLAQPKGRLDSYHIESVEIAPNGRQGTATVKVTFRLKEAADMPFTMLRRSEWLYEKDQWVMKLEPPTAMLQTFKPGATSNAVKAVPPLQFDQNPIRLPGPKGGSELVVKIPYQNVTQNTVTVHDLRTTCSCLEATIDKTVVRPDEKGVLTLTYQPSPNTTPSLAPAVQAILIPEMFFLNIPVEFESK